MSLTAARKPPPRVSALLVVTGPHSLLTGLARLFSQVLRPGWKAIFPGHSVTPSSIPVSRLLVTRLVLLLSVYLLSPPFLLLQCKLQLNFQLSFTSPVLRIMPRLFKVPIHVPKRQQTSYMWSYKPVTQRLRQEDCGTFKTTLYYT